MNHFFTKMFEKDKGLVSWELESSIHNLIQSLLSNLNKIDLDANYQVAKTNDKQMRKIFIQLIDDRFGIINTFLYNAIMYYVDKYGEEEAEYMLDYFLIFLLKFTDDNPGSRGYWVRFTKTMPRYINMNEKKIFDILFDLVYKDNDNYNGYYWFFVNLSNICRENYNFYSKNHYINIYCDYRSIFYQDRAPRYTFNDPRYSIRYLANRCSHHKIMKFDFSNQNLIIGKCEPSNKDFIRESEYLERMYKVLPGVFIFDKNVDQECSNNLKHYRLNMYNSYKIQRGRLFSLLISDFKAFRDSDPTSAALFLKLSNDLYTEIIEEKPHSIARYFEEKFISKYQYEKYCEFWKKYDPEKYENISRLADANSKRYYQILIDPIRNLSKLAAEKGELSLEDLCMSKKFITIDDINDNLSKFTNENLVNSGVNRTGLAILKKAVRKYQKARIFKYDTSKWIVAGEEISKDTSDMIVGILKKAELTQYKILVTQKISQYVKCGKDMDKFLELNPEIKKRIERKENKNEN